MERVLFLQLSHVGMTEPEIAEQHKTELNRIRALGMSVTVKSVGEYDPVGFISACEGYPIVLCGGNPPLSRDTVSQLTDSRVFIRYGIGINSIDLDACTEYGKLVYFMPGYCGPELALHALALMLGLLRNIGYYDRELRKGHFAKASGPVPRRLQNLTVGLYGLGGSGRELAKLITQGFHAHTIACDPYVSRKTALELGVELVSFEELLTRSDIISLHAPLTPETTHIFNEAAFQKMKNTAMIINTARGSLIDMSALVNALKRGEIGSAGLDVFEIEPISADNPLLTMDQVLLTPHSAFYGLESTHTQYELAAYFVELLAQKKLDKKYVANPNVLSFWKEAGYSF